MSSTVTTTVLFTDVVASTELAARLGPAAADALRVDLFGILRDAVAASGGTEVKNLGDGLMVVYPSLVGALDGAAAMARAVERRNRRAAEPVGLRVGVATGDATTDDGDYFGEPVVEAARLCARAEGGQVLTTAVVQALARRSDHAFVALGPCELKGLPEPVEVVELRWQEATAASATPLPVRLAGEPAAGLLGRAAEVGALAATYAEVEGGGGHRMVLLAGEPGIGKTSLAADLARRAHATGAAVLYGRSDDELHVPYQPFVEALGTHLARLSDADRAAIDAGVLADLSRLLPQLGTRPPTQTDPESERYLLFGAITALLAHLAAAAPVVLVIDDLHWADKPTALLLRHLATTLGPADVLVVGTYRDTELTGDHPLADVLAALRREPSVQRLTLAGLDAGAVQVLLEAMAGPVIDASGAELVEVVHRETGGNPFFTTELLRHLTAAGALGLEDAPWEAPVSLAAVGIPASVREVVGQRIRRLGDDVHHCLTVAAVIGREFDIGVLARAADRDEDDVLQVLEAAVQAQVLVEVAGDADRFAFFHDLFNHALYDELTASRRSRIHQRVAELLEADVGEDPGDRIGELARHWLAGTAPGGEQAVRAAFLAGQWALTALAPHEAIRWFRDVVDLLDRPPGRDSTLHLDALIGLGDAKRQAGDAGSRETLLAAAATARRLGDGERLVRAVLANQRGIVSGTGTVDLERVASIEHALEAVGPDDGEERAFLLATLAAELLFGGDLDRIRSLADEATAMARRLGDPAALLRVLNVTFITRCVPDTHDQAVAAAKEAAALAVAAADPVARYWAWQNRLQAATGQADRAGIEAATREVEALARLLGQPYLSSLVAVAHCWQALLVGDGAGAEEYAEEAFRLGVESGQPDAPMGYVTMVAAIRGQHGRLEEVLTVMEVTATENAGVPAFDAAHACFLAEVGRFDEARVLLDAARAADFHGAADTYAWLTQTTFWAETAAWLGDTDAGAVLYERLLPFAGQAVNTGMSFTGTVNAFLARLASLLGRFDEAEAHFVATDGQLRALGAPFWESRNQLEWARFLLARAGDGDAARAAALLESAAATAERFGCLAVLERARALAG